MLKFFYNLLLTFGFLISWPYFLWRMSRRGNPLPTLPERLGWLGAKAREKLSALHHPIWIHAVSVGEVRLAQCLISELRKKQPELDVVITTTTQTGRKVAAAWEDRHTCVLYTPFDLLPCVRRTFHAIRPSVLILVEAEIWPNQIWLAQENKIPICLVNARLSPKSAKRYRLWRRIIRHILKNVSWVGLQFSEDAEKFARAGFPTHKFFTIGSMKFDVAESQPLQVTAVEEIRQRLGWSEKDTVLLGASTHAGEEELLLRIFLKLKKEFPDLRLLIAPRHAERGASIEELCQDMAVSACRRSTLPARADLKHDVFILNTTGEMALAYSLATVVFMGKSMKGIGGQNFLEALRFRKPVVFGPNMQNFEAIARLFVQGKAVEQVVGEEGLESALEHLAKDGARRDELATKGWELYRSHLGASARSADFILQERKAVLAGLPLENSRGPR